jgi:hypothetical protein
LLQLIIDCVETLCNSDNERYREAATWLWTVVIPEQFREIGGEPSSAAATSKTQAIWSFFSWDRAVPDELVRKSLLAIFQIVTNFFLNLLGMSGGGRMANPEVLPKPSGRQPAVGQILR